MDGFQDPGYDANANQICPYNSVYATIITAPVLNLAVQWRRCLAQRYGSDCLPRYISLVDPPPDCLVGCLSA